MPDDNNTPDLSQLTEKITQLSAQLEQAKTALTERDNKIKELEGSTGGFKTANGQLTSKVTDLESQLAAAQATIQTQTGELINWTTKYDQLTQTHATVTGEAAATKKQLELYGLIAAKPEYHGLVDSVSKLTALIRPDAPVADIEALLQTMASGRQSAASQALDGYRAGGTNPAGNVAGSKPGGSLPTDPKAAFAEYQSLLNETSQEAMSRRAALYEVITSAQFGDNAKQQN
jgi:DNA repair exonuclease SbcCD ATPase subunit